MSDIAHRLILSRGGTTKVIDRLETLGYVRRLPDPEDRRATVVEITGVGPRFENAYYVTHAQHRFHRSSGYITDFRAESAYFGG